MKLLALLPLALIPMLSSAQTPATSAQESAAVAATPDSHTRVIPGYSTHEWTLHLPAGEHTRIVVDGDGDSDLDAFLFDENGNLIDLDNDGTDICILDVVPRWTGEFTLRIVNVGSLANLYELRVY